MPKNASRLTAGTVLVRPGWLVLGVACLAITDLLIILYLAHGMPVTNSVATGDAAPVGIYPPSSAGSASVMADRRPAELGVRFRVELAGSIVAVRFYKSVRNTGIHTGSLWSSAGTRLATATFSRETASGWQTVRFAHSVAVRPGQSYVASYHTNIGYYGVQQGFDRSENSVIVPLGGVYRYGPSAFPDTRYKRSTYFVDALFVRARHTQRTLTPTEAAPTTSAVPTHSAPKIASTPPPSQTAPPSGGKPGPTNTGVPAGTKLTVVNGDQALHTAGQVISGLDIHGYVTVDAPNVVIKDCIIRGGTAAAKPAAVVSVNDGSLTMERSEISPTNPNAWLDGINAENTTLTNVNIHGTVDGVKAFDNVTIQGSYIHNLSWYVNQPNGAGQTHNDAVQTYEGSRNITLRHNNMDPGKNGNSAYQVTQDLGETATDLHVEGNWLNGGGCTLNFSQKGGPTPMTGIYVTDNRFGRDSVYNCPILIGTQTILSADSGNVWDDTGQPIPAPQQHD